MYIYEHIKHLELSSRTLNALLRSNIKMTIGDLIRAYGNFASIEGLGVAGLNELDAKVSQLLVTNNSGTDEVSSKNNYPSLSVIPKKTSLDVPPKFLPEAVQKLPLDWLHLDEKTHNALINSSIMTIGDLDKVSSVAVRAISSFPVNALNNINCSLVTLYNAVIQAQEVDWFFYWKEQEIVLILPKYSSSTRSEEVIKDFPKIIEEVLHREFDELAGMIIKSRFGLGNEARWTLEDIGNACCATT